MVESKWAAHCVVERRVYVSMSGGVGCASTVRVRVRVRDESAKEKKKEELEKPGIEPGASSMQMRRSPTELFPPCIGRPR